MKKILGFIFMVSLIILGGCTPKDPFEDVIKDPFEEFIDKMNEVQNAEMLMEMTVPLFGKVELTAKIDGNITYMSEFLFVPESYTEEVNGVTYKYIKNENNVWEKSIQEEEDDSELDVVSELKFEDFTKIDENKYELNEDKLESYEVSSLVIELTDDGAILLMKTNEQGMVMEAKITIRKIGKVSITLPQVK